LSSVVYLLHGLMCDKAVWEHQNLLLSAQSSVLEVRQPSFRGCNSLEAMAARVLSDAPAKFSVAGHSMGGRVVWELLAMAPERVDKVAVLDSGCRGVQAGEAEKRNHLLSLAKKKGLDEVGKLWIGPMLHPKRRTDSKIIDNISAMLLRNTPEEYEGQIQALLNRQDRQDLVRQLQQTVWYLVGDEDGWSSPDQHREMYSITPKAQLHIIPNAGHMSTMEQPEAVSDLLVKWVNS
jgi:pimeloyl-ACP methyl ester carboxylesterase